MSEIIDVESLGYRFKMQLHGGTDLVSNIIRENKRYSDNHGHVLKQFIRPNTYFVDIGANIGWYSVLGAQLKKDNVKIFAYEPELNNFQLLNENLKLNGVDNTKTIQKALGHEIGEQDLYLSENNLGDHILSRSNEQMNRKRVSVPVSTLDTEFTKEEFSKISLIKIDAQGYEPFILEGMKNNLKSHKPVLFIEFSPSHIYQCGGSPFDIFSFIEKYGYTPYLANDHLPPESNRMMEYLDIGMLLDITKRLKSVHFGAELVLVPNNYSMM